MNGTLRHFQRSMLSLLATILLLSLSVFSQTFRALYIAQGNIEHGVTLGPDGNLYGTAMNGGPLDFGMVFKLTRQANGTWSPSILHIFQGGSSGRGPASGVTLDKQGNLYGVTAAGGTSCTDPRPAGCGVVYKLSAQTNGSWRYEVIHAFSGAEGSIRETELTLDAAGNLYGFTEVGNTNCCGVVFRLKPNTDGTWTESIVYAFKGGADGNYPIGNLVFDNAGYMYGETARGGSKDCGVVFRMTPTTGTNWTKAVVHDFCMSPTDGSAPQGGLTKDSHGTIFGTTSGGGGSVGGVCSQWGGCGTVFQLKPQGPGAWTYRKIHTFLDTPSAQPQSGVAIDGAGNLYGTTSLNGTNDVGTLYKLVYNPDDSYTVKNLHIFAAKPAVYPLGRLIFDKTGTLYGTTVFSGDPLGPGVVYKMIP